MERDVGKMELLKAIKEIMETQFGSLATKLDAWREEMQVHREARRPRQILRKCRSRRNIRRSIRNQPQ
jgi:archaeosine-15-forming tRNA-guanine transglycosylase